MVGLPHIWVLAVRCDMSTTCTVKAHHMPASSPENPFPLAGHGACSAPGVKVPLAQVVHQVSSKLGPTEPPSPLTSEASPSPTPQESSPSNAKDAADPGNTPEASTSLSFACKERAAQPSVNSHAAVQEASHQSVLHSEISLAQNVLLRGTSSVTGQATHDGDVATPVSEGDGEEKEIDKVGSSAAEGAAAGGQPQLQGGSAHASALPSALQQQDRPVPAPEGSSNRGMPKVASLDLFALQKAMCQTAQQPRSGGMPPAAQQSGSACTAQQQHPSRSLGQQEQGPARAGQDVPPHRLSVMSTASENALCPSLPDVAAAADGSITIPAKEMSLSDEPVPAPSLPDDTSALCSAGAFMGHAPEHLPTLHESSTHVPSTAAQQVLAPTTVPHSETMSCPYKMLSAFRHHSLFLVYITLFHCKPHVSDRLVRLLQLTFRPLDLSTSLPQNDLLDLRASALQSSNQSQSPKADKPGQWNAMASSRLGSICQRS